MSDSEMLAAVRELVAPKLRTNRGHEFDNTTDAFAAGRNEIIDAIRLVVSSR
jgi:hypothetical protein